MKYLVLLFFCALINSSTQDEDINQCIQESKVDPEIRQKGFAAGDLADNQNFKCYLKCMAIKTGTMKDSGEFVPEVMKSQSDAGPHQEKYFQAVDNCGKSSATDLCQKAYDISKCIYTELKQNN